MSIDFKKLDKDGEDFELLVRDVLESYGAEILSSPSRGPDQKKDLIVKIKNTDQIGNTEENTYLVQCKHKAHSGQSVLEKEIGDFRSACLQHKTDGYFLVTSSIASVSVQNNLEAEHKGGNLKTCVWDRKILESKIEGSSKYSSIIKRYNLKDDFEVVFKEAKRMLLGEHYLPYDFSEEINEDDCKGLIFTKKIFNNEFSKTTERLGYFCSLKEIDSSLLKSLKENYDVSELSIINISDSNSSDFDEVITLDDLHKVLQGYRDNIYQTALWTAVEASQVNPTAIRIIESCIKRIPYKPQKITADRLNHFIQLPPKEYVVFLIKEAVNAAVQLKISTAKNSILNQLSNSNDWGLDEIYTPSLAQTLVGGLVEFERDNIASKDVIFDLFSKLENEQVKAELIYYFKELKIPDKNNLLSNFFENLKGKELPATHHGTSYERERVSLLYQASPLSVDDLKEAYMKQFRS